MSQDRVPKHKRRLATDIEEVKNEGDKLKYKVKSSDPYNESLGSEKKEKKQEESSPSKDKK